MAEFLMRAFAPKGVVGFVVRLVLLILVVAGANIAFALCLNMSANFGEPFDIAQVAAGSSFDKSQRSRRVCL